MNQKIFLVVPTIRQSSIVAFLAAWDFSIFAGIIIVEDNPERSFALPEDPRIAHYCWRDIDQDLGVNGWIIPRRTDCVRSYGYLKAHQAGADVIITLDDDCLPVMPLALGTYEARPMGRVTVEAVSDHKKEEGLFYNHIMNLKAISIPRWVGSGSEITRGFPYEHASDNRFVVISHGLWRGVLDHDAVTSLSLKRCELFPFHRGIDPLGDTIVPRGMYFPMCGMNLAWSREMTPAMYFLLMGQGHPYDRLGDIWCGILAKKICDHLGLGIHSGGPYVQHDRASNVWANLRKEAPGMEMNETFWSMVDVVHLTGGSVADCYIQIAREAKFPNDEYFNKLRTAMEIWANLFK